MTIAKAKLLRLEHILKTIERSARAEILKDFRADSCIASTKVVIRVLQYFGYRAVPVPVFTMIFNKQFLEAILKGDRPPKGPSEELNRWCDERKAWSVGVGGSAPREDGFQGHLVAIMPDHHILIDASLDQANRPDHNIVLPGVFFDEVTEGFVKGKTEHRAVINDCGLVYKHHVPKHHYAETSDWQKSWRTDRATMRLIEMVERAA